MGNNMSGTISPQMRSSLPSQNYFTNVPIGVRARRFFGRPIAPGGTAKFGLASGLHEKYYTEDGMVTWRGASGILQIFYRYPLGFGKSMKQAGWTKVFNQIFWNILFFIVIYGGIYKLMIDNGALNVPQGIQDQTTNTYAQGLYFATVTITTLGFGDITPATVGGQVGVMFHILLFLLFNFIYTLKYDFD